MNKLIFFFFILFYTFSAFAQNETLSILKSNNTLYFQTKEYQNQAKLDYIDENIVVNTNAITLPFVDDFTKNTLKPYNFNEVLVTDTIIYATGTCINNEFVTQNIGFHTSQSYYYFYNTTTANIDSTALPSVNIYNYSSPTCFPLETSITAYWPSYYRSTLADFNISTGLKLDSTLVTADVVLEVATIYFANLPSNVNWVDNYAWWNTTNPVNPISIGVATLDGLNEFGLPYNNSVTNAYGEADVLTSKPIDLSLLGPSNDVYLSFFYEAGGLGDFPNPEDSLLVEFRGLDGEWVPKWSTPGTTDAGFRQAYIPIYKNTFDSLIYSNTSFQFRFKNYASLSGNNDLWNIDYVRLDTDRIPTTLDTVIRDVTVMYDFPNFLQTYSMLPWNQLQAGADSFRDTINIPIRDNGQVEGLQAGAFPLNINITNTETADIIYTESGSSFNPQLGQEIKRHEVLPSANFVLPTFASDSVWLNTQFFIAPVNRNSKIENDTINNTLLFHNVMAYDDGTAERAYGVSGGGSEVKKFAYEFNVAEQDTLAAVQIHFSNIDENVSDLIFSLYVWDSLEIGVSEIDPEVHIMRTIENKKPNYINEKNGFATFVFDTPVIVTGKFYVGWAQIDNRNLQIGYDLNSAKGREKMFVFAGNNWQPSIINTKGSPMLRVILDGDFPIPNPTSIANVSKLEYIKVYPNPASTVLNIEIPESLRTYEVSVIDFTGRQVYFGNESIVDVSNLPTGMYLLSIKDLDTSNRYTSKFLVR